MRRKIFFTASIAVICLGLIFLAYNALRTRTTQVSQGPRVDCPAYSLHNYIVKEWRTSSTKEGAFLVLRLEKNDLLVTLDLTKAPIKVFVVPKEVRESFQKYNKLIPEVCVYFPTYAQEAIDGAPVSISVLTAMGKEALESKIKDALDKYNKAKPPGLDR